MVRACFFKDCTAATVAAPIAGTLHHLPHSAAAFLSVWSLERAELLQTPTAAEALEPSL